jgi:hypothetical protein
VADTKISGASEEIVPFAGEPFGGIKKRRGRLPMAQPERDDVHAAWLREILSPGQPLFDLTSFFGRVGAQIQSIDPAALPIFHDSPLSESRTAIIQAFNDLETATDVPPILADFRSLARSTLRPVLLSTFLNSWPLSFPTDPPSHAFLLFLLGLIPDCAHPLRVIHWARDQFCSPTWPMRPSTENSVLKLACVCRLQSSANARKEQLFWATVDASDRLEVCQIAPRDMAPTCTCKVSSISRSENGKMLNVLDSGRRQMGALVPTDPRQIDIWLRTMSGQAPPFPIRLTVHNRRLPPALYRAVYEALIADDLLVVRSLTHYTVARVSEGFPLAEALLDIFSHAGRVNQLVLGMVGAEFDVSAQDISTSLRSNTHLTNLFKVFAVRYGKRYKEKVIQKIINFVMAAGDLRLKYADQPEALRHKTRKLVFSCLDVILRSGNHIAPQIRHLASVIRAVTGCRFNSKQATFNALSSFFYLRFISVPFADSVKTGNLELFAFAQLLQVPFSASLFGEKVPAYASWNHHLCTVFPNVINFMMSIAELDQVPEYKLPSNEGLEKALDIVMDVMLRNCEPFAERYQTLLNGGEGPPTVGWGIGAFLISFFKDSVAD